MFPITNTSLLVDRANIRSTQIHNHQIDAIEDGQILIEVDQFALTANNITYAAIGEQLMYWNFFPTDVAGHGIVPVWGYAKIVTSKVAEIREGTIIYGYLPMSKYFVAEPGRIAPHGFRDIVAHRQKNAAIYNNYDFIKPEHYTHPSSPFIPIIRPLFTTSFLLYHFFTDKKYMGADRILLSSASSKTALALASLLSKNKDDHGKTLMGITSDKNKAFVEASGLYEEVYTYDEIAQLPKDSTVIADFAGNKKLLRAINNELGDHLKFISAIGLTDWEGNSDLDPVPKATFFFAPTYAETKLKQWGPAEGVKMIQSAMMEFIKLISQHIQIKNFEGFKPMQALYTAMVDGTVDPKKGNIIKPN